MALHPDPTWVQSKECATLLSSGPQANSNDEGPQQTHSMLSQFQTWAALVTTPTWHCEHNWPFPVMLPLLMGLVASFQHFALVQAREIECFLNPCSNIYVSVTSTWVQGSCLVLASSMNQKSSTIPEPGLVSRALVSVVRALVKMACLLRLIVFYPQIVCSSRNFHTQITAYLEITIFFHTWRLAYLT